jgi:hypothetical protein
VRNFVDISFFFPASARTLMSPAKQQERHPYAAKIKVPVPIDIALSDNAWRYLKPDPER